ncbi:hypothetical protein P153DRAFT_388838 [Dothidotthia symphoricarpi CBS 119687]|uniref:Uncharacterized protein n=1 Tax=Dothidotthia symphoricarpi CBS 119687 TaxID=1392245 RepID=A0A6A6A2K9_9PLEO|nr:uncharacterized protein P153DRAFT_388838 [Dothidotthia symphoricarpi CBS 119687]KAF2126089.1 hypothetical protein P153DRAFT_388838 [Dothidotthia symphoricarpi CBS 119687]
MSTNPSTSRLILVIYIVIQYEDFSQDDIVEHNHDVPSAEATYAGSTNNDTAPHRPSTAFAPTVPTQSSAAKEQDVKGIGAQFDHVSDVQAAEIDI